MLLFHSWAEGPKLNVLIRDKISFVGVAHLGVAHLTRGGRSCSMALYHSTLQSVAVCCSGLLSHKKEGGIRNSFQINTYMNLLQCVVALLVCYFVPQSVAERKRWWTQVKVFFLC